MSYAEPTRREQLAALVFAGAYTAVMVGAVVAIAKLGQEQQEKMKGWGYGNRGR